MINLITAITILGPGALAPASPGVLERVEATRIKHGYGLTAPGPRDAIRVAIEDCALLGATGVMIVDDTTFPVYVVDCQQKEHTPLSELGLVADVNRSDLAHESAVLILWKQRALRVSREIH